MEPHQRGVNPNKKRALDDNNHETAMTATKKSTRQMNISRFFLSHNRQVQNRPNNSLSVAETKGVNGSNNNNEKAGCSFSSRSRSTSTKTRQMYLDLGQQSDCNICTICGMLFVPGVSQDDVAHRDICRAFTQGVVLRVNPQRHRVLASRPWTILEVRPNDSTLLRNKVASVQTIVHQELGFVPKNSNEEEKPRLSFLAILGHRVVGMIQVEPISRALQQDTPISIQAMGVHLIWVHSKVRHQGVASKLLDMARSHFCYGTTRPLIAFSSPTQAGMAFALEYLQRHKTKDANKPDQLLVYDCTWKSATEEDWKEPKK